MERNFFNTTMAKPSESPTLFHAAEQPFNRGAFGVEGHPLFTIALYSWWVLTHIQQPDFNFRPLWSSSGLSLAPLVQLDDGNGIELVNDKAVIALGVVTSIGKNIIGVNTGAGQRASEGVIVADICRCDFYMDREFMGSIRDHVNLVPEPSVHVALLALGRPPGVVIGNLVLAPTGVGFQVCAIYGDDLAEVFQMVFKSVNSFVERFLNQVVALGQFGDETAVSGLAGNGPRAYSGELTERGVVFQVTDKFTDGANVEDVACQVATPEGLDAVALTAPTPATSEGLDKFGIVKGVKNALELRHQGRNGGLPCGNPHFIIIRDHRAANTCSLVQTSLGGGTPIGVVSFRTSVTHSASHDNGLERIYATNSGRMSLDAELVRSRGRAKTSCGEAIRGISWPIGGPLGLDNLPLVEHNTSVKHIGLAIGKGHPSRHIGFSKNWIGRAGGTRTHKTCYGRPTPNRVCLPIPPQPYV